MRHAPLTLALLAAVTLTVAPGCIEHRVKTEPIHITVDVNLRVEERLREFFEYEQQIEERVSEEGPPPQGAAPSDPAADRLTLKESNR